jgi:hypothetical protein
MMSAPEHCHGGASIALPSMIRSFSSVSILANVLRLPNKTLINCLTLNKFMMHHTLVIKENDHHQRSSELGVLVWVSEKILISIVSVVVLFQRHIHKSRFRHPSQCFLKSFLRCLLDGEVPD